MIDEIRLRTEVDLLLKNGQITMKTMNLMHQLIDSQPKEQPKTDCSECTRRKFYQKGYQDGLNADKWIPIEKELPKKHDDYIVTYEETSNGKVRYYTSEAWFEPQTHEWHGNVSIPNLERKVIAWQEKQKPYERMTEREGKCAFEQQFPRGDAYICKKTALICTAERLKYCKYKQPQERR